MSPSPGPAAPSIPGFTRVTAATRKRYRLIVSLAGQDKSGKTHFALSAPGGIAFQNFDRGEEGVIDKFIRNKHVVAANYLVKVKSTRPEEVAQAANEVWAKFKADHAAALASPAIRSVVVDTEVETWELIRLARFGKLTQVMPHHYGPVNNEYASLMKSVYDTDKNLILLSRLKDEWENYKDEKGQEKSRKTGRLERKGQSDIPFVVQVNATTRFVEGEGFEFTIQNCRQNPDLNGMTIGGGDIDFAALGKLVYPESQDSDWI